MNSLSTQDKESLDALLAPFNTLTANMDFESALKALDQIGQFKSSPTSPSKNPQLHWLTNLKPTQLDYVKTQAKTLKQSINVYKKEYLDDVLLVSKDNEMQIRDIDKTRRDIFLQNELKTLALTNDYSIVWHSVDKLSTIADPSTFHDIVIRKFVNKTMRFYDPTFMIGLIVHLSDKLHNEAFKIAIIQYISSFVDAFVSAISDIRPLTNTDDIPFSCETSKPYFEVAIESTGQGSFKVTVNDKFICNVKYSQEANNIVLIKFDYYPYFPQVMSASGEKTHIPTIIVSKTNYTFYMDELLNTNTETNNFTLTFNFSAVSEINVPGYCYESLKASKWDSVKKECQEYLVDFPTCAKSLDAITVKPLVMDDVSMMVFSGTVKPAAATGGVQKYKKCRRVKLTSELL